MDRLRFAAPLLAIAALFNAPFIAPALAEDAGKPPIVITEIMYNPDSAEKPPNRVEWVELYNAGKVAVELSGWRLKDEDGQTGGFAKDTIIAAGEAVVIVPDDLKAGQYREAWGDGFTVVPVSNWGRPGLSWLANAPSSTNENLTLVDGEGEVVDRVNYDDQDDWPTDDPDGASIYLLPGWIDADANDHGKRWARSEVDKHGARPVNATKVFNGEDVGSPGRVVLEADEGADEGAD